MHPRSDRLNEQVERARLLNRSQYPTGGHDHAEPVAHPSVPDQESHDLALLAQHLQSSPHLRADPDFARRLEQRMLRHHAAWQQQHSIAKRQGSRAVYAQRSRGAVRIAIGLVALLLIVGVGLLVTAVQAANPTGPLAPLYHLIRQSSQPAGEATAAQAIQRAQQQLDAVGAVTDPAQHEVAYQQMLVELEQTILAANACVTKLPMSAERDHLERALSALTTQARHVLLSLLPQLTLAEQQTTTEALGILGERIPVILAARIALSTPPTGTATITLTGRDIESGAVLVIDGRVVGGSGMLQDGMDVFVVPWKGTMRPHSVGILNPDGMVAQTSAIQVTISSSTNHGKGNGSSGNGNLDNGKGTGKPTSTPTPSGNPPPSQH
ncbi:MAG: hypothetical protein WCD86_10755 [Ktedonobacteraceae bacterium]